MNQCVIAAVVELSVDRSLPQQELNSAAFHSCSTPQMHLFREQELILREADNQP